MCVCVCVHVCVRACVRVCICQYVSMRLAYATLCIVFNFAMFFQCARFFMHMHVHVHVCILYMFLQLYMCCFLHVSVYEVCIHSCRVNVNIVYVIGDAYVRVHMFMLLRNRVLLWVGVHVFWLRAWVSLSRSRAPTS